MPAPKSGFRRLYVRWLPVALATVASANLILATSLRPAQMPIRLHDDGSLTHLAHVEGRTVDRRYAFYLELGDAAAGEILFVPEQAPISPGLARGLSDVEVLVSGYDPTVIPLEAVPTDEPLGVLETPRGDVPYWILQGDGPRWLGHHGSGILIVPESVSPIPGRGS